MKRALGFYLLGVVTVCGALYHAGPDFLLTAGAKWEAASKNYAVSTRPVADLDESMGAEVFAYEPPKARKGKR